MTLAGLEPWRGALLALLVAVLWTGVMAALRRPGLAAAGAGLGLAAGWALTLGLPTASPRQLAERLPALAVAATLAGLLLAPAAGRSWAVLAAGAGVLAGAWWLGGAPLHPADLARGLVPLLALALLAAALLLVLDGAPEAVAAGLLQVAGLWLTRPAGPWLLLAAASLAASVGALAAARRWPIGARLAPTLGIVALAAGPVLARGGGADWAAAAGPVAALWLGPAIALRLGGRWGSGASGAFAGWSLAGGAALLFAWLLGR